MAVIFILFMFWTSLPRQLFPLCVLWGKLGTFKWCNTAFTSQLKVECRLHEDSFAAGTNWTELQRALKLYDFFSSNNSFQGLLGDSSKPSNLFFSSLNLSPLSELWAFIFFSFHSITIVLCFYIIFSLVLLLLLPILEATSHYIQLTLHNIQQQ